MTTPDIIGERLAAGLLPIIVWLTEHEVATMAQWPASDPADTPAVLASVSVSCAEMLAREAEEAS